MVKEVLELQWNARVRAVNAGRNIKNCAWHEYAMRAKKLSRRTKAFSLHSTFQLPRKAICDDMDMHFKMFTAY
jgi:hypothetical protein